MRCPFCQIDNDSVRDSRAVEDGRAIRRRRYCHNCRRRFTTFERTAGSLSVIKKNGEREPFARQKIEQGLELACRKRKVSAEMRAKMADAIESELQEEHELEVPSSEIGRLCMQHLAAVDQVAYVRFASVYRDFQDIQDFMQELKPILKNEPKPT